MKKKKQKTKNPSLLVNILINIFIPYIILTKGNSYLDPIYVLLIALLFPLSYLIFYMIKKRNAILFSYIGLFSILLTGLIGLLEIDIRYLAIKEAGVPLIIAFIIIISENTNYSLFKKFLNEVFDFEKIYTSLKKPKYKSLLIKKNKIMAYFLALSFLLSSILNYVLAKSIVKSPPGTALFNSEIAKMTALSFPVIAVPSIIITSIILTIIILDIKKYTDLEIEDIIK